MFFGPNFFGCFFKLNRKLLNRRTAGSIPVSQILCLRHAYSTRNLRAACFQGRSPKGPTHS